MAKGSISVRKKSRGRLREIRKKANDEGRSETTWGGGSAREGREKDKLPGGSKRPQRDRKKKQESQVILETDQGWKIPNYSKKKTIRGNIDPVTPFKRLTNKGGKRTK